MLALRGVDEAEHAVLALEGIAHAKQAKLCQSGGAVISHSGREARVRDCRGEEDHFDRRGQGAFGGGAAFENCGSTDALQDPFRGLLYELAEGGIVE